MKGSTIMNATKQISVLLVEDHVVMREGLSALLSVDGRFKVAGEARTGREAVKLAEELQPDVILMDIALPELNGLEATRQIMATNPAAKVVVLTAHSDHEYVERMNASGAAGFLEKQTSAKILTKALNEVAKGKNYYSPGIARRLRGNPRNARDRDGALKTKSQKLTVRESEVLQLVAEGLANKQIATTLFISVKTVEKHRQQLMDKLNIHDTAGLTRFAIATGVIECGVRLTII